VFSKPIIKAEKMSFTMNSPSENTTNINKPHMNPTPNDVVPQIKALVFFGYVANNLALKK